MVTALLVLLVERNKIHRLLDHLQVFVVGVVHHPEQFIDIEVGQESDGVVDDTTPDLFATFWAPVDTLLILRVGLEQAGIILQHWIAVLMNPHLALIRHALNVVTFVLRIVVNPHRLTHQTILLPDLDLDALSA